jgi:hypothetical protein
VRIAIDAVRLPHAAWTAAWRGRARLIVGNPAPMRARVRAAEEMLTKLDGIALARV